MKRGFLNSRKAKAKLERAVDSPGVYYKAPLIPMAVPPNPIPPVPRTATPAEYPEGWTSKRSDCTPSSSTPAQDGGTPPSRATTSSESRCPCRCWRHSCTYPTPASLIHPPLAARSPARTPGAMLRLLLTLTSIHLSSRLGATLLSALLSRPRHLVLARPHAPAIRHLSPRASAPLSSPSIIHPLRVLIGARSPARRAAQLVLV
ncbi:hypothetical protein B0H14DRAFT_3436655 [Mycena olivaceomarginata]|nr:hypothetical protein B0H14DRAFT_3436655 [Mycena olivaceomarginata]